MTGTELYKKWVKNILERKNSLSKGLKEGKKLCGSGLGRRTNGQTEQRVNNKGQNDSYQQMSKDKNLHT